MSEIKVSDRRMFTPDGRLREEYERELAQAATEPEPEPPPPAPAAVEPPPAPAPPPAAATTLGGIELPVKPPPGLLEHVEFLAQLALVAMGEMPLPDGRLARDLDGARFYVDLIGLFHQRYGASLGPQEARFLESYLDQLRLRYVAHRG